MNILEFELDKIRGAAATLLSPGAILSLPQLAVAFGLAFTILALRRRSRRGAVRPRALLRAIFAKKLIFNRSVGADLIYFGINTFVIVSLVGWGIFSGAEIADFVTGALTRIFGEPSRSTAPVWALRAGMTVVAFLSYEFGYYVDHWLKHRIPALWELHKTHHTAEVLNPLTVFRVHPLDTLIFVDIVAVCGGVFHSVYTYAIGQPIDTYTVAGTNALLVMFFFLVSHLQHSQFWLPLTGWAGRLVLSPAHHQLHHSADPQHFNTNFGSFIAIFDWMFGTLYVPQKESPRLKFGAAELGEDPHSITALLIDPVVKSLAALGLKAPERKPAPSETASPGL